MLPEDTDSIVANTKLSEEFNMNSTHMLLVDSDMKSKDVNKMLSEMKNIDGISFALGMDTLVGSAIPQDVIPDSIKSMLKSDDWQLMLIGSEYKTISVAIQYLRGGYGSIDLGLMMSMLVLAIIPIVIFYMICQKWIIQGVIAGAVKG